MAITITDLSDLKLKHINAIEVINANTSLGQYPIFDITSQWFDDCETFSQWPHSQLISWKTSQYSNDVKNTFRLFADQIHKQFPDPQQWGEDVINRVSTNMHLIGTLCDVYYQLNIDIPDSKVYGVRYRNSDNMGVCLFFERDRDISVIQELNVIKPC